jgi:hypothetical protein
MHAVGRFCRGGKAMNEPSANSFFVVLLFILRCLVPLAVLFGVAYLLRRMGLIAVEAPEPIEEAVEASPKASVKVASPKKSKKSTSAAQSKKSPKKKVSPPREKTARKTKTENSRSRSK